MICRELIELLEKTCHPSQNPGIIRDCRWKHKSETGAFTALDATGEVIRHAIDAKADLLLTHHPMLMWRTGKINTAILRYVPN